MPTQPLPPAKHFLACTMNGLMHVSCHSVFWGLKCAWILLSDAAVLGGLSGPGVIISQVSYCAADSLIGYGCFFPSRSFIGLFIFLFFLVSIVLDLDFSLSTGQLPSLPLSTSPSELEPILSISLRLDSNWVTSAAFSSVVIPHNNMCASTTLTARTVNHTLFSYFFSWWRAPAKVNHSESCCTSTLEDLSSDRKQTGSTLWHRWERHGC